MKRLAIAVSSIALAGVVIGVTPASGSSTPILPICFSYHKNASVETFAVPTGTHCPSGYTYGAGTIATTAQLIAILNSVSTKNFRNGTAYGKAAVRKCISGQKPSALVRSLKC